jgi:hypothetical protein
VVKAIYWILLAIDAIVLGVLVFFFCWGLTDGTVSSFNMLLWLVIMAVPAGLLAGSVAAWRSGQRGLAIGLLVPPAVPSLGYGLLLLVMIVGHPDFR